MSSQKKTNSSKESFVTDEHPVTLDDLIKNLNTDVKEGLTTKQAAERLEKYGLNELTLPQEESLLWKFVKNQFTGCWLIFWITAALCFLLA